MSAAVTFVRMMAANNAWANDRLLSACEALSPEEFAATRTSFFPSLRATLNHILEVDRGYLADLEGMPAARGTEADIAEPSELKAAQAAEDGRLIAYCGRLAEDDLSRTVLTDRLELGRFEERVGNVLAHLFQHQIHHRGQAHAMLAGTGVPPPQLDEFFLAFDRAPTADRYWTLT